MTDPIADMLTRLRNAIRVRKEVVRVPYSGVNYAIASLIARQGYLVAVERRGRRPPRYIEIAPRYLEGGISAIQGMKRISRPGRRVYQKVRELRSPRQGVGIIIISTPQGIMSHREARRKHMGGEALLAIW